ncbi:SDR family oxidoreductase [Pseudomonas sp. P1B16]|uniref:SDR family oxidoreductase n=1 Tax=Pseudomonas sp. P1B16 TaxID=2986074 RepID=UPI002A2442F0|nr:SDR family oxidoreductase [Pseudomonas sp. P1B16]WPM27717.1 SDR family oxidoreductase [Pseudomonas sp. P1B16]
MSGQTRLTVFLTGGAGVLGDTLIDQLAERYHLVCLTRRSSIRHPGVETLRGDICQPHMGLSHADYLALTKRVDWVIHCAAITRLDGHAEAVFSVNYQGTEQVLQFVRDADVPLYHISTAFTHPCDYHPGVMPSTPYEVVKRQAETLVREAGVPVSIFRPSIIIGDSHSGHMPMLQGFHLTMGLMMSGYLPIIPCPEGGRVDVIARDVAAAGIASALDQRLIGDDYFLTNGPQALDIRTLLDLMCEQMQDQSTPFQRPRCMNPDIYERLVRPVFLPAPRREHPRSPRPGDPTVPLRQPAAAAAQLPGATVAGPAPGPALTAPGVGAYLGMPGAQAFGHATHAEDSGSGRAPWRTGHGGLNDEQLHPPARRA